MKALRANEDNGATKKVRPATTMEGNEETARAAAQPRKKKEESGA